MEGRPAHDQAPNKECDGWPHPENFYMLPPVWRTQNQQVAAPGRGKGKGRSPLDTPSPLGIRQPRCGGKQEPMKVCKKGQPRVQGGGLEAQTHRELPWPMLYFHRQHEPLSLNFMVSAVGFFFLHSGRMTNFKD